MKKKKTTKSRTARSMRDLPRKAVNAKAARSVRGGGIVKADESPKETITFTYGGLNVQYTQQKPD